MGPKKGKGKKDSDSSDDSVIPRPCSPVTLLYRSAVSHAALPLQLRRGSELVPGGRVLNEDGLCGLFSAEVRR